MVASGLGQSSIKTLRNALASAACVYPNNGAATMDPNTDPNSLNPYAEQAWSNPYGLPADPSMLAQLIATPTSRQEQVQAWETLWATSARAIAEQVKARFGRYVPQDFVDHAQGRLWEKLVKGKYDWRKGAFPAWWRRVLMNKANDLYNEAKGNLSISDSPEPESRPDFEEFSQAEALQGSLVRLREVLDELSSRPELVAQVNYYAVLLVELRRAMVQRLRERQLIPGLAKASSTLANLRDSQAIAAMLPWRTSELELRFRPGFATIGAIWRELEPYIDRPPYDLRVDVARLHMVTAGGTALTRDAWYNWKRHLQTKLTGLVDESTWTDLFSKWF
jgi:DNA-directed RNA polymerase specialized sigma24 family protein